MMISFHDNVYLLEYTVFWPRASPETMQFEVPFRGVFTF